MAVDEALLESASRGETVLRFYTWTPATLSLGYFQDYADRRLHEASSGLDVVRRSTGGGAIVHDHELTYSFATPISQRFSRDHQGLVRAFHETLCESLASWQIVASLYSLTAADSPQASQATRNCFLCFQRRALDDVVVGNANLAGAKIAGSAQRRRRNALIQHGSVLLARSTYAPELGGIGECVEQPPTSEGLRDAWAGRLANRLGFRLVPGDVTEPERQSAADYSKTRFEATNWQQRR